MPDPNIWTDPDYIRKLMAGAGGSRAAGTAATTALTPPRLAVGTPLTPPRAAYPDPVAALYNANAGVTAASRAYDTANQNLYGPAMTRLSANQGVLDATAGTFGPRADVTRANWGVLGAQGAELAGQRGVIGQQQGFNQTQLGQTNELEAARNNVPDITAVGQAKRYNGARDAQLRQWGIAPDQEVVLPPGATAGPGTRAAPMTQEQTLSRSFEYPNQRSELQIRGAQLAVQLLGTNTQAAEQAARAAGLTLEEAQQVVAQAQNKAGYASNAFDEAQTNLKYGPQSQALRQAGYAQEDAKRPPFAGAELYTDPSGRGSWVTPGEADLNNLLFQHLTRLKVDQQTLPQSVQYSQQRQQAETQAQAQGSPLAPLSTPALLNMIPTGTEGPVGQLAQTPVIEEIVRRLMFQGYSQADARAAAQELIRQELLTRRGSGGSTPAYGGAQQPSGGAGVTSVQPTPGGVPAYQLPTR